MVLDLLGNNIERLAGNIDYDNICVIIRSLVIIIENIHNKGVIHRDLKPDNVLFSLDNKRIYLIDYGLSTMYIDEDGKHLPEQTGREIVGNISYISRNIHSGIIPSRRDDLISVCYMAFYLLDGTLPWSLDNTDDIGFVKDTIEFREYYGNHTNTRIFEIYDYCNKLTFNQTPNYDYICKHLTL
jgi:serine/threonine protein kinase